jgi:hypothetical protein
MQTRSPMDFATPIDWRLDFAMLTQKRTDSAKPTGSAMPMRSLKD